MSENGFSGKSVALGAAVFFGMYYVLGQAGYRAGSETDLPLFAAPTMDAETAKLLISGAAAVIPLLWEKFPKVASVIRQLLARVDGMSEDEIKHSLERIESKLDALAEK